MVKKFLAVILAALCMLTFMACGGKDNSQDFSAYKTERIEYVETLSEEDDTIVSIVNKAKTDINAVEYDKQKSLDENKQTVDAIVSKAETDIASVMANISYWVANEKFKKTFAVSGDLENISAPSGTVMLLAALLQQDHAELAASMQASNKLGDYYEYINLFFLPDGKFVNVYKGNDLLKSFYKALDKTLTDEQLSQEQVTVGTYTISSEPKEAETTKYTISVMTGEASTYTFDVADCSLTGSYLLGQEKFVRNKNIQPPQTGNEPETPTGKDPYEEIVSGGAIEAKYLAYGDNEVEAEEFDATGKATGTKITLFKVWYPKAMTTGTEKYPLVVVANGTGVPCTQIEYFFKHLASWGFIVIGNNEGSSGNGLASERSLEFMLELNAKTDSKFYGKIDTDKIGSTGHSQGGPGAINAVTAQPHGNMYKAVYVASATHKELAAGPLLNCPYDLSKMNIPYFAVAGTGTMDAGDGTPNTPGIAGLASCQANHNAIPNTVEKIFARRKNADHGQMVTYGDGYMVAWFMWHLKGDESAKAAFYGNDAEITKNANWQDVTKNI